jgi:hypothetical protein
MMNQEIDNKGKGIKYINLIDCIRKITKENGLITLWSGFTAMFLRLAPHTVITFIIMEKLREFFSII